MAGATCPYRYNFRETFYLLVDLEHQCPWKLGLEDNSVEYLDVERLDEEHGNISDLDINNTDVEIDHSDCTDIWGEDMNVEEPGAEDMGSCMLET